MDATALNVVMRYSAACGPSPIVRHILMCLAYATPSKITDFSGCILKGAKKGDGRSNTYYHSPRDNTASELQILEGVLAHGEKISKRSLMLMSGLCEGTIAKHKRMMLNDQLVDDKWGIRCDVLERKIKEVENASRTNGFGVSPFVGFPSIGEEEELSDAGERLDAK